MPTISAAKKRDAEIKLIDLLRLKLIDLAKTNLISFIHQTMPDYRENWHHRTICNEIDAFLEDPDRDKLMVFVPPQHGKSEIISRKLPAYFLGRHPDKKVIAASASSSLAKSFNRSVQRCIESPEYQSVFPETRLNTKNVVSSSSTAYLKNTEEFEVVDDKGGYKCGGVDSLLSGFSADLIIIDDPIKDDKQAQSATYRENVWNWYTKVIEARKRDKTKIIIVLTRWHLDDLAGRLLKREPEEWTVIRLEALKTRKGERHQDDHRQPGEALWEEEHSAKGLKKKKKLDPSGFNCLYQQTPKKKGGDKVKYKWFKKCRPEDVPNDIVFDVWIDGAYTDKTDNDPTGLMVAGYDENKNRLYVQNARSVFMELPEFLDFFPEYWQAENMTLESTAQIEPKASGQSMRPMINAMTEDPDGNHINIDAFDIDSYLVGAGKKPRFNICSAKIKAGKIVLVEGDWNQDFMDQFAQFPRTADEYVDTLAYAIEKHFPGVSIKKKARFEFAD